jgi:hypothetical protein
MKRQHSTKIWRSNASSTYHTAANSCKYSVIALKNSHIDSPDPNRIASLFTYGTGFLLSAGAALAVIVQSVVKHKTYISLLINMKSLDFRTFVSLISSLVLRTVIVCLGFHSAFSFLKLWMLMSRTNSNTNKWDCKGAEILAKAVRVYDGDTFYAVANVKGFSKDKYNIISVRMNGYDSPEMKPSKNQANRDIAIQAAYAARDALSKKILNKVILLKLDGYDKYGRFLARVHNVRSSIFPQWSKVCVCQYSISSLNVFC